MVGIFSMMNNIAIRDAEFGERVIFIGCYIIHGKIYFLTGYLL
jgi:hypothetical protein